MKELGDGVNMNDMKLITKYLNLYLRSCTSDLLILDEAPDW